MQVVITYAPTGEASSSEAQLVLHVDDGKE
jgi:hypothetical protein